MIFRNFVIPYNVNIAVSCSIYGLISWSGCWCCSGHLCCPMLIKSFLLLHVSPRCWRADLGGLVLGAGLRCQLFPLCALQCSTGSLSCSMFNKCSSGPLHCWSAACSIFNNIGIVLVAVCALCIATCIVHNCYTILLCFATCCCTIVLCVSSVALPSCSRAGNDPIPVLALDYHHHCHHHYLYHCLHHFKWNLIHYRTNMKSWYIQNL